MASNWLYLLVAVFVTCVVRGIDGNGETCGFNKCKDYQVCEESDNKCYNATLKKDCQDGISYCYMPTKCCGVGTCCPQNADCCGFNTCCPHGAVCCQPNICCPSGSSCCGIGCCAGKCDDGTCTRVGVFDGPWSWWYLFLLFIPVLAVISVVIRRRRLARMRAAAAAHAAGVGLAVPVAIPNQTAINYGYDQANAPCFQPVNTAPGAWQYNQPNTGDQPPPYYDVNPTAK